MPSSRQPRMQKVNKEVNNSFMENKMPEFTVKGQTEKEKAIAEVLLKKIQQMKENSRNHIDDLMLIVDEKDKAIVTLLGEKQKNVSEELRSDLGNTIESYRQEWDSHIAAIGDLETHMISLCEAFCQPHDKVADKSKSVDVTQVKDKIEGFSKSINSLRKVYQEQEESLNEIKSKIETMQTDISNNVKNIEKLSIQATRMLQAMLGGVAVELKFPEFESQLPTS